MNDLIGIHHVTAITSSAEKIYEFFTYVLGMRLVKKTINQDDINTYHLFFADDKGSAGTDMTFFDFQGAAKAQKGTNEIGKSSFRVPSDKALEYYIKRFDKYDVSYEPITELFGKKVLFFTDFDDQEYFLISDENNQGIESGTPWQDGPVPTEYAITGLGPIYFRASNLDNMSAVLTQGLTFTQTASQDNLVLFETGLGGNGASIIVEHNEKAGNGLQGYGGIHHVAFRIEDEETLYNWIDRLNKLNANHSGFVDRFYFKSLYTRLYPGMLFEFATEGPGFIDDEESYETLGETLALPPKFRNRREEIERYVRHIDTIRSNKTIEKEYFD